MTMPINNPMLKMSKTAQAAAACMSYGHPAYTKYAEILIRRIERRSTEKAKREAEMLRTLLYAPAQIDDFADKCRGLIGELLRTQDALFDAIEKIDALEARAERAEAKWREAAYLLDEAGAELVRTHKELDEAGAELVRTHEELAEAEWANRGIRQ